MLLKIAPDLAPEELEDIAAATRDGAVDGIIVSNTTLSREGLVSAAKAEQGGLSGKPLFDLSTRQLARLYLLTEGTLPLIGVGGIHDAASALAKIEAGASLLQLYTALVYRGPDLVRDILSGIAAALAERGQTLAGFKGVRAEAIAHHTGSGT